MAKEIVAGVYQIGTLLGAANAFLIVEEQLTLIDTGVKGSQGRIKKLIEELGRSPTELTLILLTHCHVDHVGSVVALKELTGAKVAMHRSDTAYLSKALSYPKPKPKPLSWLYSAFMLPLFYCPAISADILLDDNSELEVLGGLKVIHTPGHTPGNICLYSPERNILFAGDTVRAAGGEVHMPYKRFTDNWDQARNSLNKLRGLQTTTLCFGHGEAMTAGAQAKLSKLLDEATM